MLRNQATALLRYEHLTTTVARAKELRPFVERLITIAKRGVSGGAENGRVLGARRHVMRDLQDREVVTKLFSDVSPRFSERPGGYTRILKLAHRQGDGASMAFIEFVDYKFEGAAGGGAPGKPDKPEKEAKADKKKPEKESKAKAEATEPDDDEAAKAPKAQKAKSAANAPKAKKAAEAKKKTAKKKAKKDE